MFSDPSILPPDRTDMTWRLLIVTFPYPHVVEDIVVGIDHTVPGDYIRDYLPTIQFRTGLCRHKYNASIIVSDEDEAHSLDLIRTAQFAHRLYSLIMTDTEEDEITVVSEVEEANTPFRELVSPSILSLYRLPYPTNVATNNLLLGADTPQPSPSSFSYMSQSELDTLLTNNQVEVA